MCHLLGFDFAVSASRYVMQNQAPPHSNTLYDIYELYQQNNTQYNILNQAAPQSYHSTASLQRSPQTQPQLPPQNHQYSLETYPRQPMQQNQPQVIQGRERIALDASVDTITFSGSNTSTRGRCEFQYNSRSIRINLT